MVLLFASFGHLSCFVVLLWILSFFVISFLSKKTPKKLDTAKKTKSKIQKKSVQKQTVSAVVFTNNVPHFWGVGLKMHMFAENTIKIVVSAYKKTTKGQKMSKGWVKTWSKVASKLGPSMLCNIVGPSFDSRKGNVCLRFYSYFLKNLILPPERRIFLKKKGKKRRKLGPSFVSKKGYFWTKFWLYSTYIYIYIYVCVCVGDMHHGRCVFSLS